MPGVGTVGGGGFDYRKPSVALEATPLSAITTEKKILPHMYETCSICSSYQCFRKQNRISYMDAYKLLEYKTT